MRIKDKVLLIILIIGYFIVIPLFLGVIYNLNFRNSQQMLSLFEGLTENKIYYEGRKGELFQFPENVRIWSAKISAESDANRYYGLKPKGYNGVYDSYADNSPYARDVQKTVEDADKLLKTLTDSGLLEALRRQGKKPAIMFDIDNTLEFTSRSDDDVVGEGPPIKPTVEFAQDCLKKGIECYFITARSRSNSLEAAATKRWLKHTFNLSDLELRKYVFLMGDFAEGKYRNLCPKPQNASVAYKDLLRKALSERDGVFWLMSVGDQLTDVYGKHSGVKILIPNLLFDNAIVPNPYYGKNYRRNQVMEPSSDCYFKLKDLIIDKSRIEE